MSEILNNDIKISDSTKNNIKSNLKKIYQENINSKWKQLAITKSWTSFCFTVGIIAIILFIVGIVLMITNHNQGNNISVILFITGAIIVVISTLGMWIQLIFKQKIKKAFTNDILLQYYSKAAKNNIESLTINDINSKFSLYPENFIPLKKSNSSFYSEKVILGNYLNHTCNLGTILEKIREIEIQGDKQKEKITYNRYLYLTINIPQYDYTTIIKPETFFNKIRERNQVKLESSEFEKIFAVDYSDPIKLRKLFQPKVMAQMIDYSQGKKQLPSIYLNQTQVTLMIPYLNINSPSSKLGSLTFLKIRSSINTTLNNIVTSIEDDLTTFISLINWVKILDLL